MDVGFQNMMVKTSYMRIGYFLISYQDIKNHNVILKQVKKDPWKKVKQEDVLLEGCMTLKIGIKRNQDGCWKVSGVGIQHFEENNISREIDKKKFQAMLHSSNSATASNRVDEDASVN